MKRLLFLLSCAALVACSEHPPQPYATTVGMLRPGATMTVRVTNGVVNVFRPKIGDKPTQFTITASAYAGATPKPSAPTVRPNGTGVDVSVPDAIANLLVRVPDGVNLRVDSTTGNVNVTDVTGNILVRAGTGSVKIMVPGYAEASTHLGDVNVTMGATHWPGTLHISSDNGDVTVYVRETDAFHVRMHTDDGTLFTDFDLRGTSHGLNETIDAPVNGGSAFGLDLESKRGAVRLLRLTPQA